MILATSSSSSSSSSTSSSSSSKKLLLVASFYFSSVMLYDIASRYYMNYHPNINSYYLKKKYCSKYKFNRFVNAVVNTSYILNPITLFLFVVYK